MSCGEPEAEIRVQNEFRDLGPAEDGAAGGGRSGRRSGRRSGSVGHQKTLWVSPEEPAELCWSLGQKLPGTRRRTRGC